MIAPIYPARELPIAGIDHHLLVQRIQDINSAPPVTALNSLDDAVALAELAISGAQVRALPPLRAGDVIITLGAGDVDRVAHGLV